MRKHLAVLCLLLAALFAVVASQAAMAEEALSVIIHDPIRMSFDVLGGSGSYEVVSATLSSGGSVIVSTTNPPIATPNGLESGNYYLCTITVRDVATGEVATGTGTERYFSFNYEETWDCNKYGHDASEYDYEIEDDYENSVIQTGKYFDITETHHSVRVIKSYRCVRCSTYMYSEETVVTSEHKYGDNGLCSCGAQKAPECLHTNTSVRDGAASRIMVSDNADQHKLEQIHETYCLDCGRVVSTSTDTEWENHTFNDKDYCVCGYYKAPECRHINTTSTCVGNSYTPHEVDPYLHWEMPEYKITCLDCGYVSYETWSGIPYPHEFDKNGECVCGCRESETCSHETTDRRDGTSTYNMDANNSLQHKLEQAYEICCIDCGTVISFGTDSKMEDHAFDADGDCICGYKRLYPKMYIVSVRVSPTPAVGGVITVSATVTGGSGTYTYGFEYADGNGEMKHINGESSSASFTITGVGRQSIKVTVTDVNTGESVTESQYFSVACTTHPDRSPHETWEKDRAEIIEGNLTHHRTYHETWQNFYCNTCQTKFDNQLINSVWGYDLHTFNAAGTCTACLFHIDNIDNRYQLNISSSGYTYGDMMLVAPGDVLYVDVLDTADGSLYNPNSIEGMKLIFNSDSKKNKITEYGILTVAEGTVELTLKYYGKEIGKARVGATHLSVTEWGLSEGAMQGTSILRLEDMMAIDWDATGMTLSDDIMMFDFTSTATAAGAYIIHFDVFNACGSTYAVASYYPDGTLCEKHFINSYSPDFWAGEVICSGAQAIAEGFDRKAGNSGFHTQKTCIEIYVPAGGCYTFLEAHEDEEVLYRNIAEQMLSVLGTASDVLDTILIGDTDQIAEVQKALKKSENAREFVSVFVGALTENMIEDLAGDPTDILKAFSHSSEFVYELMQNKSIQDALLKAIKAVAVDATVKTVVETTLELASPALTFWSGVEKSLINALYFEEQRNNLEENNSGICQIPIEYIVVPE